MRLHTRFVKGFLLGLCCLVNAARGANTNHCARGLGLENGQINDDQIIASENTTAAGAGRLNNPDEAWCFAHEKIFGKKVSFTVDLGAPTLVSGFQSQGPPKSQHPIEYLRYVGLEIRTSLDGITWDECCGEDRMTFYADDRRDEANVVATHSFKTVLAARFVRILASTEVRWIGEAEKCFRFEILGCNPANVIPEVNFNATSEAAGYLSALWSDPTLIIADNMLVNFPTVNYLLNVSHLEDGLVMDSFNLTDTSLILPKPLWDTTYTFDLKCSHFELDLIDCGRFEVKAIIEDAGDDCLGRKPTCPLEDRVVFVRPKVLGATSLNGSAVKIEWTDAGMGWRTPKRSVKVIDENLKNVVTSLSNDNEDQLLVEDLKSDQEYQLVFAPEGPRIPKAVQQFSTTLALLPEKKDPKKHRAFISSVNLRTSIIWSGQIRAFWDQAKASKTTSGKVISTKADSYIVTLKKIGGQEILEQSKVKGMAFAHDFGGIESEAEYEVSLTCIFGSRQFQCGYSSIYSDSPILVQEEEFSAKIFVQDRIPRSWQNSEYHCRASGGHLVSLDSDEVETSLASETSLLDFWSGGNLCKNTPAPSHSMWSDGSAEFNTNFATNSGLDGNHCCVKVEVEPVANNSKWKGETCDTLLHGICEFSVDNYLDTPSDVFGKGLSPGSINMSWTTDGMFWQPSEYTLQYCHLESLSKAALPIVGNKCKSIEVGGHRGRHETKLEFLEPFSEYEVTVTGRLEPFEKTTSTVAKARTLPKNDIEWIVTSKGVLKLSWLKKIADYQENDKVHLVYNLTSRNESHSVSGTAKEVSVPALRFGETYQVVLIDQANKTQSEPITIQAFPNCTLGLRQNMTCNYVSKQEFDYNQSRDDCQSKGFESLPAKKDIPLENVQWSKLTNAGQVWIGNYMPRSGKADREAKKAAIESNNQRSGAYCQAWSIRRSTYQSVPCDTKLPVFCQSDLLVEPPSPSKNTIRIRPGPTHITLDWSKPEEGWKTSYKIHVVPSKPMNRTRREERANNLTNAQANNASSSMEPREIEIQKSSPPVNITDLLPETEYNFVITTSLNSKWTTTFNLDEVATTANDSNKPEGIIGFTGTSEEYKAAELSIFSIIMAMIATAIVVFIISGTLPIHADNAVQVCFEVSLLSCHVFTMLAFLDGPMAFNPTDQTLCILAMTALSFLSLICFTFLFLESLCIAGQLVQKIVFKQKIKYLIAGGFLAPLAYCAIILPILYEDLIPSNFKVCWLNLESAAATAIILPISILFLLSVIFLLISIFGSSSDEELQAADRMTNRTETLRWTRYVMLAITMLMGLAWSLGITSSHFQLDGLVISFLVVHLLLSLVILVLRCIMDKQVKLSLKRWANRDKEYQTNARARSAGIMSALSRKSTAQVAPEVTSSSGNGTGTGSSGVPAKSGTSSNPDSANRMTPVESNRTKTGSPTPPSAANGRDRPRIPAKSQHQCPSPNCGWHHASNALWVELENSPYNRRKNQEALRRFRRMCNDTTYVPKTDSSLSALQSTASSNGSILNGGPAKYTSPFGNDDESRAPTTRAKSRTKQRTPFVYTEKSVKSRRGASRSAAITGRRNQSGSAGNQNDSAKSSTSLPSAAAFQLYMNLPHTPDTEDPYKTMNSQQQQHKLQFVPGVGTESYI